ncbi:uncharacterized protein LOC105694645 [Orussus abietinus]|uniref:uncharacterized protein LOC105694645 n=1 Tax=Orussus abietinus TaxID=222816 RepID=UPI000C716333|nr:uncharacterized protein LOC105694645 [Orussus abietinus]
MPGVCPRCLREVYFAEEKLALGKVWHTFCFSCRNCRKLLDSCTVTTHCGELFCRNCCTRLFSSTVQPPSPPPSRIVPPAEPRIPTPAAPVVPASACESLTDCCCCCCCEESALGEPHCDPRGSNNKRRLHGGGGEDEEPDYRLEVDGRRCSESDYSNLGVVSSVTTLNPPPSPTAVTAWYNRQHSASQSTFASQPCAGKRPARPSSASGVRNNCVCTNETSVHHCNINGVKVAAPHRLGSPCRSALQQQQQQHQYRQHNHQSHNSQQQQLPQESKNFNNNPPTTFVHPRPSLRSRSPGGRTAGGGGCCDPRQDDGGGGGRCCAPKLPPGCECLGGGLDCQRCGRKVYQAEMQIVSGVPYHNICFSCFCCRKPLEPLTYQENCGEIYCKQCYVRNFGPQGYGYGAGAGVLQTPM